MADRQVRHSKSALAIAPFPRDVRSVSVVRMRVLRSRRQRETLGMLAVVVGGGLFLFVATLMFL